MVRAGSRLIPSTKNCFHEPCLTCITRSRTVHYRSAFLLALTLTSHKDNFVSVLLQPYLIYPERNKGYRRDFS